MPIHPHLLSVLSCSILASIGVVGITTDAAQAGPPVEFGPPSFYPAGDGASAIDSGDLNGDGFPDIVVSNNLGGTISVLLNDGAGGFLPQTQFAVGPRPEVVKLGDLDGDGDLDVAIVNTFVGTLSVLLNDGAGVMTEIAQIPVGGQPNDLALADLDGDGDLDAITANQTSSSTTILYNAGDATFPNSVVLPSGPSSGKIDVGDYDNDGDLDLLVSRVIAEFQPMYQNDGKGGFTLWRKIPSESLSSLLMSGDVDQDGDLDLVSPGAMISPNDNNIVVRRQYGDAQFTEPASFDVQQQTIDRELIDLDEDGLLDLVVTRVHFVLGVGNEYSMLVIWGDPVGSFSGWQNIAPDPLAPTINAADLASLLIKWDSSNGDCDLNADGVVNGRDLGVLLVNWGVVTNYRPPTVYPFKTRARSIEENDFDQDGDLDLAIMTFEDPDTLPGDVMVILNNRIQNRR